MIYFVTAREIGRVKIGHASDPRRRLAQLQTGSPVALRLERICDGGEFEEGRLHALFAHHRIAGEWFALAPEIETHMASLLQPAAKRGALSGHIATTAGISRSHASDIVNAKRKPSRALAIHIYRKTGWRHQIIAGLTEAQIDLLETVEPWRAAA